MREPHRGCAPCRARRLAESEVPSDLESECGRDLRPDREREEERHEDEDAEQDDETHTCARQLPFVLDARASARASMSEPSLDGGGVDWRIIDWGMLRGRRADGSRLYDSRRRPQARSGLSGALRRGHNPLYV